MRNIFHKKHQQIIKTYSMCVLNKNRKGYTVHVRVHFIDMVETDRRFSDEHKNRSTRTQSEHPSAESTRVKPTAMSPNTCL